MEIELYDCTRCYTKGVLPMDGFICPNCKQPLDSSCITIKKSQNISLEHTQSSSLSADVAHNVALNHRTNNSSKDSAQNSLGNNVLCNSVGDEEDCVINNTDRETKSNFRLSYWIDWFAKIFGIVLIIVSVSMKTYPLIAAGLVAAGVVTVISTKKKTILWRSLAGVLNGFGLLIGVWMLLPLDDNPFYFIRIIFGCFYTIACGLGVVASIYPQPHHDIVNRNNKDGLPDNNSQITDILGIDAKSQTQIENINSQKDICVNKGTSLEGKETISNLTQQKEQKTSYGGISRRDYFFSLAGIVIFVGFVVYNIAGDRNYAFIFEILFVISVFTLSMKRMRNIGMNVWWSLFSFVPLVNFILIIICVIRQEGYIETKKLDTAGRIILGIILAISLVVGTVLLIAMYG